MSDKYKLQNSQPKDLHKYFILIFENYLKVLQSYVRSSFRKVRIMKKKKSKLLRNGSSKDDDCNHEIEHINKLISDMEAEIKQDKFMPHFL
jgi:hypothetical protein